MQTHRQSKLSYLTQRRGRQGTDSQEEMAGMQWLCNIIVKKGTNERTFEIFERGWDAQCN